MSEAAPAAFAIAGRPVGSRAPCLIVGEIAQAHDGSLGAAHASIDAVAETGADAVKFQTHIAAAESTPGEPFRVRFSPQDETRYDYWRRMEFTPDQWRGLADHARACGLLFLSSPFSFAAVELLAALGMPAWKVGSGELGNRPFLERLAATGKPVLLSSGMSPWAELDAAVAVLRARGAPVAVLQCTTAYPCPPERWGLNVIAQLARRYGCPAGFSDHSGGIVAGLAAATLGAALLEVHVTFSRRCFGPDVPASVTVEELALLVRGVRAIETAHAHPIDKDREAAGAAELRAMFGRSLVAAHALPAGRVLAPGDLALKKPGGGLGPDWWDHAHGRRLRRALAPDERLHAADFEAPPDAGAGESRRLET